MTIKVFEMFAGYGGASFGLKRIGIPFECVGYSEIDKTAIKCYDINHKGIKNYGDATKINPDELPDFDLLTAGFPCQAFSTAGLGKGELDTRGTLFNEIIRISEIKKPKYMLLENVKGLITKKHETTFHKILEELDRIGYIVKTKVLNSMDYGTPQSRERIWFMCFREDVAYDNRDVEFPEKEQLIVEFKHILEDLPFREIPTFLHGDYCGKPRLDACKTTADSIMHTLTTNRTHANQYLLNPDRTMCRNFTKIESMRCMGFKDDEINLDNLTDNQAHKLAGNGWDINTVSKIFKEMFKNERLAK